MSKSELTILVYSFCVGINMFILIELFLVARDLKKASKRTEEFFKKLKGEVG